MHFYEIVLSKFIPFVAGCDNILYLRYSFQWTYYSSDVLQKVKSPKAAKGGKRAKKDPNAPKKAATAYMLWLNSVRPSLTKPGMGVTDVAKAGGEKWRAMTAAQKAVRSQHNPNIVNTPQTDIIEMPRDHLNQTLVSARF